ncbi:2-amino-4-hydroxy-6-hydroxymethyldihydropteridine diphosphokinase [Ferruginibacter lapsinanis]|uniref:2-amino-4-hydroxy-6- hydroxymethyldihydropteridine diphosphokinase n=1 Tax=Ferruginibacter lapsinanis TaxID=563172 RepID=UPI001E47AD45|nr:2-amino-4-hydroxy-6-hydroxymethyldihydropteridine diphosphokinase [Ferruginibacter lapsinanis]UEG49954.1 2-amino-4-hydroxy-6-hydroxymethyldihydropteridine diphosphokinase [Ferruginibacter lapsinanis]
MNKTYLLLGSNMGNSKEQLLSAQKNIKKQIGKITRLSSLYQTAAWGNTNQPDFLNQVIIVETRLSARETIKTILSIEKEMGRIRTVKNAPRVIDIDILFYNKEIINDNDLKIPHPEIQNRNFVLSPLNELSPNMKHPVLNKTIHYLLTICKDKLNVKKF